MSSLRRAFAILLCVGLLALLGSAVGAQAPKPADPKPADPPQSRITLPVDSKLKKKLEAAQDLISEKEWETVAVTLQQILDLREDVLVQVLRKGADGKEVATFVSAIKEAERLVGSLPADGRKQYLLKSEPTAKDYLVDAVKKNDPELLARIAQRFFYTRAGGAALQLLCKHHDDAGFVLPAAIGYERLLKHPDADELTPETLYKATLAFRRADDKTNADQTWKKLKDKLGTDKLKLGDRMLTLEEAQKELDKELEKTPQKPKGGIDWSMFRGDPSRSAQASGGTPFLERKWYQPIIRYSEGANSTKNYIDQAVKHLEDGKQAVLPSFYPIAANVRLTRRKEEVTVPLVLFRSFWGIHAVDVSSGKLEWESPSDWSFDRMLNDNDGQERKATNLRTWISAYINSSPQMLVENSIVGTLSTDNTFVYVIEDLALPPSNTYDPNTGRYPQYTNYGPKTTEAIACSKLLAHDLKSGKLIWSLGGKGEKGGELADSYFLGPPLPLGGKLYVLTEKNQELILVCLDPTKDIVKGESAIAWKQTLATTSRKMIQAPLWRTHAAQLAYGDGILVCSTNAGGLLGVDLHTRNMVWAYVYQGKVEQPQAGKPVPPVVPSLDDWKVSAPSIQDGKVVFTAPDGKAVHCVNLRDGSPVWEAAKTDDDLYLAGVFSGKVLIVGKNTCRALSLTEGKQLWSLETGMPSGQGIAADNVYYLPLKSTIKTKEPEVCAIDIAKGQILAHTKSRKKADGKMEVPGNLLFFNGDVISQTVQEVTAYPQLKVILEQIDERLKKNPNDPQGLLQRGELKLEKGDLEGAIEDFRKALENKPPQDTLLRIRPKLYEAMTELLQRDFDAFEKLNLLKEYDELCKVEGNQVETQRRQATRLYLTGKGREKQGKLVEALAHYLDFTDVAGMTELLSLPDEQAVKVSPDVWVAARIAALFEKVSREQRKPLEEAITKRLKVVRDAQDINALRRFVAVFGTQSVTGREARLELAQRLLKNKESFAGAESHLLVLRRQKYDTQLAGEAVEALAKLYAENGLLDDAVYFYRILSRDFTKTVIRNGKTGADLFKDLAADKRFLPFLEESGPGWMGRKYVGKQENFASPAQQPIYSFTPDGELLPFFQRHRVALNLNYHQLNLIDRTTGETKWSQNLTRTKFQNYLSNPQGGNNNPPPYPYQMIGHLVVLQLAHMVYVLDPINNKVLWEKNLFGSAGVPANPQIMVDPRDGSLILLYPDGWIQNLGQSGPVEASYVCLLMRDGLQAFDPLSGRFLWQRSDVSARTHVFGDEQHIFLVEKNADGKADKARTLRAADGTAVPVPDFSKLYEQRLRVLGGQLLASESNDKGLTLRLYDIPTGKDIWKKSFAADSVVLRSEVPHLAGVIEPDGKVTVVDLTTRQEVFTLPAWTKENPYKGVDPKHLEKVQAVYLLQDRVNYYLAFNGPVDPQTHPWGGPWSNLAPTSGIRSIPVNGEIYAIDRARGALIWRAAVPAQSLVLEQFNEMPVLLFSSCYKRMINQGRGVEEGNLIESLDKSTGKLVYRTTLANSVQQFYALTLDTKAGRIDFLSYNNIKISHYVVGDPKK